MPQDFGIHPCDPATGRASAKELGTGIELLMDLEAGHEAEGLVVSRGHLMEKLVGKVQGGVGAGIMVAGGTDPEAERLVELRTEARAARNWAEADRLRDALAARGWLVEDTPQGPRLKRK